MSKFKVGDRVRFINSEIDGSGLKIGDEGIIKCIDSITDRFYIFDGYVSSGSICPCGKHSWVLDYSDIELITTTNKTIMSSLKEKFALTFKKEPEKTFIKAGILNSDESFTTDGKEIFLSYLLKKNGEAFKTEVVDALIEEKKD